MNALEIKAFYSPDIDVVWEWEPHDNEVVLYSLELNIGLKDGEASDVFQIMVATPKGLLSLAKHNFDNPIISDRACLILGHYSWLLVVQELEKIVARCSGVEWMESTLKLQRYFRWEYEDYVMEG